MAEAPIFVSTEVDQIQADIIARFEELSGRVLRPAHVERLLLNTVAYRETLIREAIQYSATQNLVSFATGLALDYLGQLVGVTRLAATPAKCFLIFEVENVGGLITVPEGTRVASSDGSVVFRTTEQLFIDTASGNGGVVAEATVVGTNGNNIAANGVNQLLDPFPYFIAVYNDVATDGGADQESDDGLRERIVLASGQFTTAGSRQAYEYHARTANPSIIDVDVLSEDPGTVQLYILMDDGEFPGPEIVADVLAACSSERVRPLNDLVTAQGAEPVEYEIEYDVTLYSTADAVTTLAASQASLEALVLSKRQKCGQNVPPSQVVEALMVAGVYEVEPTTSFTEIEVAAGEYAKCIAITLNLLDPVNE